jgi:predicted RNA polymerase sigma factor
MSEAIEITSIGRSHGRLTGPIFLRAVDQLHSLEFRSARCKNWLINRQVIYLIFNEGYAATSGTELVRHYLCEAIRLGRVLCELLPQESENIGLLALMLLQDSRRDARVMNGALVTLEEQDRSLWDRGAISEGMTLVEEALRLGPVGPYQFAGSDHRSARAGQRFCGNRLGADRRAL